MLSLAGASGLAADLTIGRATEQNSLDPQFSVAVDGEKYPGLRHSGRIVDRGALLEGFEQRLDFAEPGVGLVRQLVRVGVSLL